MSPEYVFPFAICELAPERVSSANEPRSVWRFWAKLRANFGKEVMRCQNLTSELNFAKKSIADFGVTGLKCEVGQRSVGILLFPPEDDDEWQVRPGWLSNPDPRTSAPADLVAWDEIRELIAGVVRKIQGVKSLDWVSHQGLS